MTFLFLFLDLIKTWEFTHIILLSLLKFLKLLAAGRVTQWSAGLNPNILEIVYRSLQCLQTHVLQYLYFNVFFLFMQGRQGLDIKVGFLVGSDDSPPGPQLASPPPDQLASPPPDQLQQSAGGEDRTPLEDGRPAKGYLLLK